MNRVDIVLLETVNDHYACIVLILSHHIFSHGLGARDAVVEIVSMCSTDIWNIHASLSPSCSIS